MVAPCVGAKPRSKTLAKRGVTTGKLVHVVRHGEAQHNVKEKYLCQRDTRLTSRGFCQAKSLQRMLPKLRPQLVVTSDLLRALQTTRAIGFRGPTVVEPDAREKGGWPCNDPIDVERATAGDLQLQFGGYDWSMVLHEAQAAPGGRGSEHQSKELRSKIKSRAVKLTRYLESRIESSIVLVSHGAFLEELTGDDHMSNCEVRTYNLVRGKWQRLKRYRCRM